MWKTQRRRTGPWEPTRANVNQLRSAAVSHPRLPSVSHGFAAFMWGLMLGLFIWLGMLAVGVSGATSFIVGAVSGVAIFVFVRVYGAGGSRRQAERRGERAH